VAFGRGQHLEVLPNDGISPYGRASIPLEFVRKKVLIRISFPRAPVGRGAPVEDRSPLVAVALSGRGCRGAGYQRTLEDDHDVISADVDDPGGVSEVPCHGHAVLVLSVRNGECDHRGVCVGGTGGARAGRDGKGGARWFHYGPGSEGHRPWGGVGRGRAVSALLEGYFIEARARRKRQCSCDGHGGVP